MAPCMSKFLTVHKRNKKRVLLAAVLALRLRKIRQQKRKHRFWVHDIFKDRKRFGIFHHLMDQLNNDEEKFKAYLRLDKQQFNSLFQKIEGDLRKENLTRKCISSKERLCLTLRFLATGESYRSLSFSYRIGITTIARIIPEVCQIIWDKLKDIYMPMPQCPDDWKLIAENFKHKWQFPNCIGALDGKHVVIKAPANSGSRFFNYKGTFSVVLLALVNANLQFLYLDIGSYGRNSDGGIFSNSSLGKALCGNKLNLPADCNIPEAPQLGNMPYVIIGDEAFPLHRHIMRPYPGRKCGEEEQLYNFRLSRARRIVENAFGILASRWRIYHTKMAIDPSGVNKVVKATCILHNMLQESSTPAEVTSLLENNSDRIVQGLEKLPGSGYRGTGDAMRVRDNFKRYFVEINPLSWQNAHIRRGLFQ